MLAQTFGTQYAVVNDDYVSRLDEVGPADRKIFAADGTRYVGQGGLLDIDISIEPHDFGAFTSWGAWDSAANAYGVLDGSLNWDGDPVRYGNISGGQNLPISYRHSGSVPPSVGPTESATDPTDIHGNRGGINALFFDGHVSRLNDRRSRDIDMWYPSGSIVQDPIGMTAVPNGYEIP
jgi:prepilin-type processing-associated H-X9-DG protein